MSDDGQLLVNFARLQDTSGHIQAAIGSMSAQLDQLEQAAAPLVATWDGSAREAYQQRQAVWRQAAVELTATLSAIKRALDESAADYLDAERRNTQLFR